MTGLLVCAFFTLLGYVLGSGIKQRDAWRSGFSAGLQRGNVKHVVLDGEIITATGEVIEP